MPDEPPDTNKPDDHDHAGPRWDPAAVLRSRLDAARHQLDESVAALRSDMDDDQILADFGLDLGAIDSASGHPDSDAADDADMDPDGGRSGQ